MLDLLIAGGGPAGLVTALYAARAGLRVEVVEPRPAPIDKACGEGLMPGAARALTALLDRPGVAPALTGMPLRGISYLDGVRLPDGSPRRVDAPFRNGPGLGVRRTTLHAALTAAVRAAGVDVVRGRVTGIEQDGVRVRAELDLPGCGAAGTAGTAGTAGQRSGPRSGRRAVWCEARYLAAADGLHSPLRRLLGLQRPGGGDPRWGLRRHYAVPPWSSFVEVHWAPGAEVYVTPVGPGEVGVAVLTRDRSGFDAALGAFPAVRDRLADAEVRSEVRGAGPLRQRVSARRHGRVLLVGDAAGYVDALTGEGLAIAVRSARALVECVVAGRPEAYERRWRADSRRARLLTEALLRATRFPAVRRALVPAAVRLPAVFEAAVDRLAR